MPDEGFLLTVETELIVVNVINMSLKVFAAEVISNALKQRELDDPTFYDIKARCVHYLKNIESPPGMPIEQVYFALNLGLNLFTQIMDEVIATGKTWE
jgi:hypothetical protein